MQDCPKTPEDFERSGQITDVDGCRVFSVSAGDATERAPVLYLHGIPTWSWLWRNALPETGQFTRSIAVDLPGFGPSGASSDHSFRVLALAETMEHFLDQEVGPDEPASLVVHDFGALVGAEMIARKPDRYPHLVITNTSLRPKAWTGGGPLRILSVPWIGQLSMWLAQPWMLRLAMRPFVADPRARSDERFAGYWYPFEHGFGQSLARLYQERPADEDDFQRWRNALSGWQGRTMLMWGGRDPAFTLAEMEDIGALLPDAESIVFQNASHFLPEERPMAVGRRIRAFLEQVPRQTR